MGESIVVAFAGDGAGEGPLAWGQVQCWRAMVEIDSSLAMGAVFPIPDGAGVEPITAAVRFWLSRYASMRTRLRLGPDGSVTQVVSATGEIAIRVVEADQRDPGVVADELLARWKAERFDDEREWPVRFAVVTSGGRPCRSVVAVNHLAADGSAIGVMVRELAEQPGPYMAPQPLELAERQRTAAGQRQTAAALRHWGTHLRAVPARRLPPPQERPRPRYRRLVWDSPALHLAALRAATRTGTDTGAVLLAAVAVGLGRVTGIDPFVGRVIVSNRFRPGLADVVSPIVQTGLCVLAVAEVPLDEAVARAVRATMSASKHAYYDPDARDELVAAVERERGERVDLGILYNDRRSTGPVGPVPSEEEVARAAGRTRVVDEVPMAFFNEQLMVNVEDVPGTVRVTAEVDTRHLSMADLREVLNQAERAVLTG